MSHHNLTTEQEAHLKYVLRCALARHGEKALTMTFKEILSDHIRQENHFHEWLKEQPFQNIEKILSL